MGKKLDQTTINKIINLHNQGLVSRVIAEKVGISKTAVQKYVNLHLAEIEAYEQAEDECAAEIAAAPPKPTPEEEPLSPPMLFDWLRGKAAFIGGLIVIGLLAWLGQ